VSAHRHHVGLTDMEFSCKGPLWRRQPTGERNDIAFLGELQDLPDS
jgi:hypothetical protein